MQKDKRLTDAKKLPSAENNEADSIAKESKKSSDKSCHPREPVFPRLSKDQNENINTKRRKIEINNKQDPDQPYKRLARSIIPGLVWPGKVFHLGHDHYGAVNHYFPVYYAIFSMVTTNQTNA